jgi:ribosomal protein S18 acetylase RimI-like enzyme
MHVREAVLDDKPAVINLWERCGLTRPWNDPGQDFDFAFEGKASSVLVMESACKIVGAALVGHDGHRGSTYYVGVGPTLQRQGGGRTLMTAVEDWLREQGVWKLNLLVRQENTSTLAFYDKLGYRDQNCIALGKRLDAKPDRAIKT